MEELYIHGKLNIEELIKLINIEFDSAFVLFTPNGELYVYRDMKALINNYYLIKYSRK